MINFDLDAARSWFGQPDPLAQEQGRLIRVGLDRAVDLRFGFSTQTSYSANWRRLR